MSPLRTPDFAHAEVRGTYEITVGGRTARVSVARLGPASCGEGTRYGLRVDDGPIFEVEASRPVPDVLSLLVGFEAWEAGLVRQDDGVTVEILGLRHECEVVDPRRKALRLAEAGGAASVKTAMPGRIVRLLVEPGAEVKKGQALLVVEAMKMENELKAPRDGRVAQLRVAPGDLVEAGAVLVELE